MHPPAELISAIREGKVVAFVGAGLSRPLGLPNWGELIRIAWSDSRDKLDLDKESQSWIESVSESDPLWAAEILLGMSRSQIKMQIGRSVAHAKKGFSLNHALLSVIPFRGYVTTNYDSILDDYVRLFSADNVHIIVPYDDPRSIGSESIGKYIIKMHGCAVIDSSNIIISYSDYFRLARDLNYKRIMSNIFLDSNVVLLGYSLRDPDFRDFVLERFYLHNETAPRIYAVVNKAETSSAEIRHYSSKYNVHLLPISSNNNFAELSDFLLKLLFYSQKTDDQAYRDDIKNILIQRSISLCSKSDYLYPSIDLDIARSQRMLWFFSNGINIFHFADFCHTIGINLTPAHYRCIGRFAGNTIFPADDFQHITEEDCHVFVENFCKELSSFLGQDETFVLTEYRFARLSTFIPRLGMAFSRSSAIKKMFDQDSKGRFGVLKHIFRQEGRWSEWKSILILFNKSAFTDQSIKALVHFELIWMSFWTRDKELFLDIESAENIDLDDEVASEISVRKFYICRDFEQILHIDIQNCSNHYIVSMVGRAFASISLTKIGRDKLDLLEMADQALSRAQTMCEKSGNSVEYSVQNYYRALIALDQGDFTSANNFILEVRRLDEAIMLRKPGIAWLKIFNYRRCITQLSDSAQSKFIRKEAIQIFNDLGVNNIEDMLDFDYFY